MPKLATFCPEHGNLMATDAASRRVITRLTLVYVDPADLAVYDSQAPIALAERDAIPIAPYFLIGRNDHAMAAMQCDLLLKAAGIVHEMAPACRPPYVTTAKARQWYDHTFRYGIGAVTFAVGYSSGRTPNALSAIASLSLNEFEDRPALESFDDWCDAEGLDPASADARAAYAADMQRWEIEGMLTNALEALITAAAEASPHLDLWNFCAIIAPEWA